MSRRSVLAAFSLAAGLLLLFAYAGPSGSPAPDVSPVLAVADGTPSSTPTNTATPTRTPTPTATVGPAFSIVLSLSANPISCGGLTTVFATVTTVNGVPVVDGTAVQFATSLGGLGTAFTSGGVASINLVAPANFSGTILIQATTGNLVSSTISLTVSCASAVPFQILLSLGTSSVCGSSSQISAVVTDGQGRAVPNGTIVGWRTSLGSITSSSGTVGGIAVATLTIPPNTAGTAVIEASSGGVTRQASITVSCAAAPTPAPPTTVPSSQVSGAPRLPSAGTGPGEARNPLFLYGGAALVSVAVLLFARSIAPARRRKRFER